MAAEACVRQSVPCLLPARHLHPPCAAGMLLNSDEAMTGLSPICHVLREGFLEDGDGSGDWRFVYFCLEKQ